MRVVEEAEAEAAPEDEMEVVDVTLSPKQRTPLLSLGSVS